MDHSLATRERILRAAAECFAKDGYQRTRMVNIAQAANVSRAALYQHFPGKGDLILALNDYVISEWRVWTQESVALAQTASEAIERWLRDGLADSWRLTIARVVTAEDAQGELLMDHGATRNALVETRRVLSAVLRRGVESGELRSDLDIDSTAHDLQAILLSLLRNHASERPIVTIERRKELDALVALVLRGLAASA
ncbi:MAG: TetR/AcrR family transcriptional regulator [Deltaproteobacteria bacterium]|jgi:AcrR family transcriptional regulator|nr:TetR/AcrR family transcriptional regulator [Deltaproteobacteria bacterium]